jgi:hypothetical protein
MKQKIKIVKTYYHTSEGQFVFDRNISWGAYLIALLVKIFIYCPLWFTGYLVARQLLPADAKGYYWVGSIVMVAMMLYCVLVFLKGIIIALKARRNWCWLFLLVLCVAYTSIPPAMLAYRLLSTWCHYRLVTYPAAASVGYLAYTRYQFLLDLVSERVWIFYRAGLQVGGWRRP